ncbi:hypothetical protein ROR02_30380 [Pararhodospirillum oryzae]|uniref:Uncharacterized protein n=1 Tax=Pararhodospirillum oryzae TaxID=478448 RepID=A0A512HBS9_9PROT|nr:hypothetical protein ROR02_30380 [Pararhodospirillum oryzae]
MRERASDGAPLGIVDTGLQGDVDLGFHDSMSLAWPRAITMAPAVRRDGGAIVPEETGGADSKRKARAGGYCIVRGPGMSRGPPSGRMPRRRATSW